MLTGLFTYLRKDDVNSFFLITRCSLSWTKVMICERLCVQVSKMNLLISLGTKMSLSLESWDNWNYIMIFVGMFWVLFLSHFPWQWPASTIFYAVTLLHAKLWACMFSYFLVFHRSNVYISSHLQVQDSFPFSIGFLANESPICTLSNGVLFPRGHPFPSVKILTLHRSNTFYLEAFYADPNELPPGTSPKISSFMVTLSFGHASCM